MKKSLLLALLISISATLCAQSFNRERLDSLLTRLSDNNKAMGSLTLWKGGKPVYQRAIGWSHIEGSNRSSASTETRYRIGSITKSFTAVLLFQQIEKGKLSQDSKLAEFFPQFANAGRITIGQMLQHRSGLANVTDDTAYLQWNTKPHTTEQLLQRMVKAGTSFEPDAKSAYSNTNYILLGLILEKITGKSYADLVQVQITAPLGLKNTSVFGRSLPQEAASFHFATSGWVKEPDTDVSVPGGAGALESTSADIAHFYEALFQGKLVSAKSLEIMKELRDGYGKGLFSFPFYDKTSYGHTGGIDGFTSIAAFFPSDSLAFAYCSNGANYKTNDILIGVLSIYFGRPYQIPSFTTLTIDAAQLQAYNGTYSNPEFPLKIEVRVKNGKLEAQATGQGAFPLEATAKDSFRFDPANITMIFDVANRKMTLKQGGTVTEFTKE
jgi:D-alanyl-D-alanine carboxypeptidase